MNINAFVRGDFSPRTWQKLSVLLIAQFQGMLWSAWLFRSPEVAASTPFRNMISTLGKGRMDGNWGAWIFLGCFCTFALLLIPWHLHLSRRVSHVSRAAGRALLIVGLISIVGVACVGIFDEHQMGPVSQNASRILHGFGAATAFGGHCVGAFVSWLVFASIYLRTPADRRDMMAHPAKLLVSVLALVPPLLLVTGVVIPQMNPAAWTTAPEFMRRIPFWQWSLMLSLMFWLYSMSRWYPDSLGLHPAGNADVAEA